MTDLEYDLVKNIMDKQIFDVKTENDYVSFVIKGSSDGLNERISKQNPSEDFVIYLKDKADDYYVNKRADELAKHYTNKWLDEEHLPKNKDELLEFAQYAVLMTIFATKMECNL